jgi:PE-PPE domain
VGLNRQVCRSLSIALFAGASMMLLVLMSMFSVPISRADNPDDALNTLMMGGTTMPTPSEGWQDAILTDYIDPATGGNYTPVLVPTPESLAPTSVPTGLADLQAAIAAQQLSDPGEPFLVEGYSQSAVIAVEEENQLLQSGQPTSDLTFLLLGSLNRPNGGLFERFPGLVIPGTWLDYNGAEPTDGVATIDIANQYDFFADFPQYPINLVSDLNALMGIIYAHAAYGDGILPDQTVSPDSEALTGPYASEYVLGSTEVVKQVDGDATFYFIPTTELPLLDPLRSLGVPESVLNIIQPELQVIVEAGYDRSIPFGDPTPAELIPSIDPVTFLLELANGDVQGANNAFELFGGQLPDFTALESFFTSAEGWSETNIGVPYDQVVTELNNAFDPFTAFSELEGPLGTDIGNMLAVSGMQQDVLDPILGLVGTLGGMFTS